jgi:hypothetical protein
MRRCIELLLLCLFLSACMATERAINPTQMPDTNTISTGIPVPATIASSATELATSEPIATSLKDQATPEPRSTESVETVQISCQRLPAKAGSLPSSPAMDDRASGPVDSGPLSRSAV